MKKDKELKSQHVKSPNLGYVLDSDDEKYV